MIGLNVRLKDKILRNKLRQILRAAESQELVKEVADAAKTQIIKRTAQGRGIESRAQTQKGIERAKIKKFVPLDADTVRQRKAGGFGRGKLSKLRATGRLLSGIKMRTIGPHERQIGYFGGKAEEIASTHATGRPYMSRRRYLFIGIKEKRRIIRNVVIPYFARKLHGL